VCYDRPSCVMTGPSVLCTCWQVPVDVAQRLPRPSIPQLASRVLCRSLLLHTAEEFPLVRFVEVSTVDAL
jgi:hypothetical protein